MAAKTIDEGAVVKKKTGYARFHAPVKPEFVINSIDYNELKAAQRERSPSVERDEPRKTKQRGQNKSRRKQMSNAANKLPKICSAVALGKECTYGEKCKFSHDGEAYLAAKPPDISDDCPSISANGTCKWGLKCRFYSGHKKTKEERKPYTSPHVYAEKINAHSGKHLRELRKRKRVFKKFENVTEVMEAYGCYTKYKRAHNHEAYVVPDNPSQYQKIFDLSLKVETKPLDLAGKTYLAPLTTCGNLPFRRLCKDLGCHITCSEMAMSSKLLDGQRGEWALLQRHPCEDIFGIQILTGHVDEMAMTIETLNKHIDCSFIDLNVGCPLDEVCSSGRGAGIMRSGCGRLRLLMRTAATLSNVPVTCKLRKGYMHSKPVATEWVEQMSNDGIAAIGLHGRSRQQRYRRPADWDYINKASQFNVPLIGNGDIFTYEEWNLNLNETKCDTLMIGRGALIKPWIFTEIKEQRHWDISAQERLEYLKTYVNYGLEHYGCDWVGVNHTRRFLLEWLSFAYRYIPLGILERPIKIAECPPYYVGRNDLETLLASPNVKDWIKITEMFLGPVDSTFKFVPKHKANSYAVSADAIIDALGREKKRPAEDGGDERASKKAKFEN